MISRYDLEKLLGRLKSLENLPICHEAVIFNRIMITTKCFPFLGLGTGAFPLSVSYSHPHWYPSYLILGLT